MNAIEIAGTGSAIADYLYDHVDFGSPGFERYRSVTAGDGGLEPGKLVLTEDFEEFAGRSIDEALPEILGGAAPASFNLGGPAAAALINSAQMLHGADATVRFYAANGSDEAGLRLRKILSATPVETSEFRDHPGSSPYTLVLADPTYHDGAGERTFLNNIGSSHLMLPDALDDAFFNADIRLFGGTALVPPIHDNLTELLDRARDDERLSIVTTVYDFPNEKAHPDRHWPLGRSDRSYGLIDLLMTDSEEAIRLSGCATTDDAAETLRGRGLTSLVVTCGTENIRIWSTGGRFGRCETELPISTTNLSERGDASWDTTGCGDNFAGAVIADLARQLSTGGELDLVGACRWGAAAGDFACYHLGGTYVETRPGEKLERIASIHERYTAQ